MFNNGAISFASHKRKTVAKSTMEAEYIVSQQPLKKSNLRKLLSTINHPFWDPLVLLTDSQAARDNVKIMSSTPARNISIQNIIIFAKSTRRIISISSIFLLLNKPLTFLRNRSHTSNISNLSSCSTFAHLSRNLVHIVYSSIGFILSFIGFFFEYSWIFLVFKTLRHNHSEPRLVSSKKKRVNMLGLVLYVTNSSSLSHIYRGLYRYPQFKTFLTFSHSYSSLATLF